MTEKEFLQFLEETRKRKMAEKVPSDYDQLSEEMILDMSDLLFNKNASLETRETILFWLAHQSSKKALKTLERYNKIPDEELKYTAKFALEECEMWNE
jgi:hypothetical protein